MNQSIEQNFADFDISRRAPGQNEYLYQIPTLDELHIQISHLFGSTIIQGKYIS